ncbi:hypothetical protein [Beijerinckia sp. L45]|uniref:hypothetical protein n=1 Tax=Beijerinckia sp. L45 TaxID=1641855 RepID=UPI00131B9893|nr:hypothetical protein [Beijerinckia sp. L45]
MEVTSDTPFAPNSLPLYWSDPDPSLRPSLWAVTIDVTRYDHVLACIQKLKSDLGPVEKRFIHLSRDMVTVYVSRAETDGLAKPAESAWPDPAILDVAHCEVFDPRSFQNDPDALQQDLSRRNKVARACWAPSLNH